MMVSSFLHLVYIISILISIGDGNHDHGYAVRSSRKKRPIEYRCGDDFCICTKDDSPNHAICNGHPNNIPYIPKLPKNITQLDFRNNDILVIDGNTFKNVSHLKLVWIFLSNNNVLRLESNAFIELPFLETLYLNQEPGLDTYVVARVFSSLSRCINSIEMCKMGWNDIHENMFFNLNSSKVESINLASNELQVVNVKVFSNLRYLTTVLLNNNALVLLKMDYLVNLQVLFLENNRFSDVPSFCNISRQPHLPKLIHLNLDNNKITKLRQKCFQCLPRLERLEIRENDINIIHDNFISSLPSLYQLDLSSIKTYLLIHYLKIENRAFNSSSLKSLIFQHNTFENNGGTFYDPNFIFRYCPKLEDLSLSHTNLPNEKKNLLLLFSHLNNIKKLDLSFTGLRYLPETIFANMSLLKHLVLSGNQISTWNSEEVFLYSNISYLSLKGNIISVINDSSFASSTLKKLYSLDLKDNPYICDCRTVKSVAWFHRNMYILHDYPYGYKCFSPSELKGTLLKDYNPSPESCKEINIVLLVSAPVSIIALITMSAIFLVYKCRWRLRYWLYLFSNRYKDYSRISDSDSFVYKGFVVYSDVDREWVHNKLIHKLEDQEGFRLCIRLRDFDVGKVHVDNIVDNMIISEKIILVLSNNFAKDEWCHFQLLLAETRLLKQNTDILVLVLLDEIHSDCLRDSLYKLIIDKHYSLWSDDETGQTLFWEETVSQMKRPSIIIN